MIIHHVEQNTDEWLALRAGKPTASEFSKLITSTGAPSKSLQGYAETLAGELYAGKPLNLWEGNQFTERGHEVEDEARLAYEMRTGATVEQVGFVTDDLVMYGCSPDGVVKGGGLVEIKCLPRKHISVLLYWKKHGRCPPDYIQQTQGQMLVTGESWCDIVFYQPDLPMLVIREEPDPDVRIGLKAQLTACLAARDEVLKTLESF